MTVDKPPASGGINFRSLSLFRILLGIYLGLDFFLNVLPFYGDYFTNAGLYPLRGSPEVFFQIIDAPAFHLLLITTHVLALLAFIAGYRTRGATIALFATFAFMFWRNPLLVSGAEVTARLLLLWSVFLPLARYWSIDAWRNPAPSDRLYPFLPVFALRAQISMIYLFSALYKLAGVAWHDGTVVKDVLIDNMLGGTRLGLALAHDFPGALPLLAYAIIAFQLLFTPLVYCPWHNNWTRGLALGGAFIMHLSFFLFLNVGMFPLICSIYLVALVPDGWWPQNKTAPVTADPEKELGAFPQVLCAALLLVSVVQSTFSIPWPAIFSAAERPQAVKLMAVSHPPLWFVALARALQVEQYWSLFAPDHAPLQKRFLLTGLDKSGAATDLLTRFPYRPFRLEANGYSLTFLNHRFLKFYNRLEEHMAADKADSFPRYLCRQARRSEAGRNIASVRIEIYQQPASAALIWPPEARPRYAQNFTCPPD